MAAMGTHRVNYEIPRYWVIFADDLKKAVGYAHGPTAWMYYKSQRDLMKDDIAEHLDGREVVVIGHELGLTPVLEMAIPDGLSSDAVEAVMALPPSGCNRYYAGGGVHLQCVPTRPAAEELGAKAWLK